MTVKLPALLFAVAGLAGCVQQGGAVPDVTASLPAAFDYADAGGAPTGDVAAPATIASQEASWWSAFGDPALPALVQQALAANQDLEAGRAALRAARASVRIAGASRYPDAAVSSSGSSSHVDGFDDPTTSGRLSVGYQLDLFGGNRARRGAAVARFEAQEFDQRALELAVQAETASLYFSVLGLRERLQVAESNLHITERILEIVDARYRAGAVSRFDLAIQQAAVANGRARLAALRADRVDTETALAVVLGRAPQAFEAPAGQLTAIDVPILEPGVPAALIERRPDLERARAEVRASGADVAAARAAFLPSLDLGAAWSNAALGDGGSAVGSLLASLTAPVFSGGALEGQLDQAEAREAETVARYRQAILDALREVDVALSALAAAGQRETQLRLAQTAAETALAAAEVRYRTGADDLTSLLDAQAALFDAADAVVQARLARLSAVLDLYLALGGEWAPDAGPAA